MKIKTIRIIEFLFIGVFVGMIEDLLAIIITTDAKIDPKMIFVVLLIALPFAFLSEIVVDHPKFWKLFFKKDK